MTSVIQPWVSELSFMKQSVLLSSVRGPDGINKYSAAKYIIRWYRRSILISAFDGESLNNPLDPRGGSFTGPSVENPTDLPWQKQMETVLDSFLKEIDAYPSHFISHIIQSANVLGYHHPVEVIRAWWRLFYLTMVDEFHMQPETRESFDKRLGDNKRNWESANNKATLK